MTWLVADVMTREVVTVTPVTTFKTCIDLMRIHGVSALPVVAGHGVVGIVSEADLMRKAAGLPDIPGDEFGEPTRKGLAKTAGELMTADVASIAPDASIGAAARLMYQYRVKHLPVIDASQRLVGIVSRADVLRVFMRSDESIRREVAALLDEMPLLGRRRVHVEVREGVVKLSGEIESGSLTGLLVRLVKAVPGVIGVENQVALGYQVDLTQPAHPSAAGPRRG